MEQIVQLNSNTKLSEHFTLGEFTRSGSHPEVYNIPSHEAIENMKRLCIWLEELRKRYNDKYVVPHPVISTKYFFPFLVISTKYFFPLLVISTKRSAWRDLTNAPWGASG